MLCSAPGLAVRSMGDQARMGHGKPGREKRAAMPHVFYDLDISKLV